MTSNLASYQVSFSKFLWYKLSGSCSYHLSLASKLNFVASFQCNNLPKLTSFLSYYFCALLLQPLATWSILWSAFLHSLYSVFSWLLPILVLTKFVLILWFWATTLRISVSLFKSPFWSQTQLCSLPTSLVFLKHWPCKAPPNLVMSSLSSLFSEELFRIPNHFSEKESRLFKVIFA